MSRVPVGVLISGRGSNLQALLDASADPDFPAQVVVVVSNRRGVAGLDRARAAGVPTVVVPSRKRVREEFDADLVGVLQEHGVEWVALAGFMRLLTATFLDAFPGRVLNIHPSLLPAFPGLHAQAQALAAGVRIAGATVHQSRPAWTRSDRGPGCGSGPSRGHRGFPFSKDPRGRAPHLPGCAGGFGSRGSGGRR